MTLPKTNKGEKMNINVLRIKKQIMSRKEQKLYEAKPFGSAIKFRRKEMQMTLEEGSEGICSVSYLSKLENNLIEPSEQFIHSLIDRFGLNDIYDDQSDVYATDLDKIISHLIYGSKPDKDLLIHYVDRNDYQAQLIHMGYHILLNDDEQAMKSFRDLRLYIPNLGHDEFTLFLVLMNIHLYHENRFSEAFDLLLLAPKFEDLTQNFVLLILKWRLFNAFKMHKISEVLNYYPLYVNMVVDIEHYHLLQEMRNAYVLFEAYYQSPQTMEKTLSKMNSLNAEDRDYALAKSHFFHQKYDKVILLAKPYYKRSSPWLVLYLMSLDYTKKHDELTKLLSNTDELKDLCNTTKVLVAHLKYKYKGDKVQLLNYLRREILGIKHLTDEYHVLDYLMVDAQYLFSAHQHYKEAVQVTTHYLPRLKTLKQSDFGFSEGD